MKMVKSLFLGTAAGLVAMAGAQAADLPVKAKPVQYVKICSLYGAGFYYIPGTDTCIKIGGFIRTEWDVNANGSFAPYTNDAQNRTTNYLRNRSRGIITFDVRSQTAYGTLRGYTRGGYQWTSQDYQVGGSQGASSTVPAANITGAAAGSSSTTYFDRAFIQLGGFTWGKTQSYFDFINTAAYSLQTNFLWVDTGGSGTPVFAYTFSGGNGVSATLSLEDYTEAKLPLVDTTTAGGIGVVGGTNINRNAGYIVPDIIGNLRVDQAWGAAQVALAFHNNRVAYYAGANQLAFPASEWGWAINGGVTFNLPWAAGDSATFMGTYCSGATRYCSNPGGGFTGSGALYALRGNGNIGLAWLDDGYFSSAAAGGIELPRVYSLVGAINHKWTPALQTSLYAGYLNYRANSAAVTAWCGTVAGAGANCLDFSAYNIGSRTLWNPVANLDVGVDVMYHRVRTALAGAAVASAAAGVPAVTPVGDVGAWAGILRFQRNFWP